MYVEYSALVSKFEKLINSIVTSDMDFNQLDIFLQSQMKKKDVRFGARDTPHSPVRSTEYIFVLPGISQ